jgi:hypothetical protein
MAEDFYGNILSNVRRTMPGALEQMQRSSREAIDMQRQGLDEYRGALNRSDGVNLPLLMFSAAIGKPTTGGIGGALASGMEAYGGALERARAGEMTRAEKMARIAEGIANLHKSQGGLGMEGINQQLQAAQSFGQIDNLAQNAAFTSGLRGLGQGAAPREGQGGALPPLPSPSGLGDVAQGAAPLQQATRAAAQTGAVAQQGGGASVPDGARRLSPQELATAQAIKERMDYASQPQFATNPQARQILQDGANRLKAIAGDDFAIDFAGGFAYPTGKAAISYLSAKESAGGNSMSRRVDALVQSGVPRDTALGIAAGRFDLNRHPINGTVQVVDKSNGRIVFDGSAVNAQGQQSSGAAPGLRSSMPQDVPYSSATGVAGTAQGIANTIVDAFGAGEPFPQNERAAQAMTNLRVRTQTALQDAIPGRPSNYLMQQLEKLSVSPNSPFMGPARARERFRQTRDMVQQEADRINRDILGRPQDFTPKQIADARMSLSSIEDVLRDYNAVLETFDGGGQQQRRQGGGQQDRGRNLPRVTNAAEYNALRPGERYVDPNGVQRTKGSR